MNGARAGVISAIARKRRREKERELKQKKEIELRMGKANRKPQRSIEQGERAGQRAAAYLDRQRAERT